MPAVTSTSILELCGPEAKKALTNKEVLKKVDEALVIASQWKAEAKKHCSSPEEKQALENHFGKLEVMLVSIVLDKKKRLHGTFAEAATHVMQELATALGKSIQAMPWVSQVQPPASSAGPVVKPVAKTKATPKEVVREYNEKGHITNEKEVMLSLGWNIDDLVIRQDLQVPAKIVGISGGPGGEVKLEQQGKKVFVSCASFINGEWKHHTPEKEQVQVAWIPDGPAQSVEMQVQVMKGRVMQAMWSQLKDCAEMTNLLVYKQPRAVKTSKAFASRGLAIPCATLKVGVGKAGAQDIVIGNFLNKQVFLVAVTKAAKDASNPGDGFCNPFHLIPKVDDPAEANLEVGRGIVCTLHGPQQYFSFVEIFLMCCCTPASSLRPSQICANTMIIIQYIWFSCI